MARTTRVRCAERPRPAELPAEEREPFQQELPRLLHPLRVRAPMLEAVAGEVLEDPKSLIGRDIPVALLLNFSEKPRFDERPSAAKKCIVIPLTDASEHAN